MTKTNGTAHVSIRYDYDNYDDRRADLVQLGALSRSGSSLTGDLTVQRSDDEHIAIELKRLNQLVHSGERGAAEAVLKRLELEQWYGFTRTRTTVHTDDEKVTAKSAPSRIVVAPGATLLKALPYLCSKQVIERVFAQSIDDMRMEYYDALAQGRKVLAWCVLGRFWLGLFNTFVLQAGVSVAKKIHAIWKLGGS